MRPTRIAPKTIPIRRQANALLPASTPTSAADPPSEVAISSRPSSSACEWSETSKAMAVAGAGSAVASKVAYPERESPSGSIVHSVGEPLVAVPAAYTMLAIGCQASDVAGPGGGTGSSVVWVIGGAADPRAPAVVE